MRFIRNYFCYYYLFKSNNQPKLLIIHSVFFFCPPLVQNQIKGGTQQLFQQLSKCLRLTVVQEVLFALALRHSVDSEVAAVAEAHLRTVLPALVQSYVDTEGGGGSRHEGALHDTTPEILHLILSVILNNPKEVSDSWFFVCVNNHCF